ncbi:uncharacterized protein LOC144439989 [Glandiceps talaboti]
MTKVVTITKRKPTSIYVDVGANRGDTVRSFYAGKYITNSNNKFVVLPQNFYKRKASNWTVFAFEADPIHTTKLKALEKEHSNLKIYTETAAWINADGITIYPDRTSDSKGFWGTSLSDTKKDVIKNEPIQVDSVDLSLWLNEHVRPDDLLVMK